MAALLTAAVGLGQYGRLSHRPDRIRSDKDFSEFQTLLAQVAAKVLCCSFGPPSSLYTTVAYNVKLHTATSDLI